MPLRLTIIGCLILLAAGGPQSLAQPAPPAAAQPPGRLTVAEAVADSNGDFVPDRSGQLVTLTGVIVYEPRVLGQSATVAALQDESAAISIFADRASRDPRQDCSRRPGRGHRRDLPVPREEPGPDPGRRLEETRPGEAARTPGRDGPRHPAGPVPVRTGPPPRPADDREGPAREEAGPRPGGCQREGPGPPDRPVPPELRLPRAPAAEHQHDRGGDSDG